MQTDVLFEQQVVALVEAVDPEVFRVANAIKRELPSLFKRNPENAPYEDLVAIFQKHVLPHHAVRRFMKARKVSGAHIVLQDFRKWAELTSKTPEQREWFTQQLKALFLDIVKHANSAKAGRFSKRTREELRTWINGNSRWHQLSDSTLVELDHTEGIRPDGPLVLYRGLLFNRWQIESDEKTPSAAKAFLKAARTGERTTKHLWPRPSSWTTSKKVAERFARYGAAINKTHAMFQALDRRMDGRHIDGELGVILSTLARPEDIVVDMGRVTVDGQHGNEGEMILRPGERLVKIVAIFDKHGPLDLENRSQQKHEPTKTEQVLEDVAKAVEKLDGAFANPFKGLDERWALHPGTIQLAMSYSTVIREQLASYIEALKPPLSRVSTSDIKDAEIHPDDPVARLRLSHLRRAMSSVANARTDLKGDKPFSAITPTSLFVTQVPLAKGILTDADYNFKLMCMKSVAKTGKLSTISERKPAYHTFTPSKQKEHLLGVFEDAYRATGREPPHDWEQVVTGVRSLIKHIGRLIRAAEVLETLSKMIRAFHGAHDLIESRVMTESVEDIPNLIGAGDREWFFWMDGHPPHEAIATGDDSHSYVAKTMLAAPRRQADPEDDEQEDFDDFDDDGPALDHAIERGWVRGRFYQENGAIFLQGQRDKVLAVSRHLYDSGKLAIRSAIIDFAELGSLVPGRSVELKDDDLMLWLAKGRLPRKSP